jgi:hypothetical protein
MGAQMVKVASKNNDLAGDGILLQPFADYCKEGLKNVCCKEP